MSDVEPVLRPAPPISIFNAPFWDYARRHELRLQRCLDCARTWAPPGPVCPHCFSRRFEWALLSGRGRVASWAVFHKHYHPFFKGRTPYNVAFVELDEGPRLVANIVDAPFDAIATGMPVEVVFEDVEDRFALPQFRPLRAD